MKEKLDFSYIYEYCNNFFIVNYHHEENWHCDIPSCSYEVTQKHEGSATIYINCFSILV